MEWIHQYQKLFSYDNWANNRIIDSLQEHEGFDDFNQAVALTAHIAGAQEVWLARISGEHPAGVEVWPDYDLPAARQTLATYIEKWQQLIIDKNAGLDQPVRYQNSQGTSFTTPLADILHHVVIHGQHHRAQIAKLLRNAKITPPGTDFIFFSRSN